MGILKVLCIIKYLYVNVVLFVKYSILFFKKFYFINYIYFNVFIDIVFISD